MQACQACSYVCSHLYVFILSRTGADYVTYSDVNSDWYRIYSLRLKTNSVALSPQADYTD
jgi:hypothetical protein